MTYGAHIGGIIAAHQAKLALQHEEEKLTQYSSEDLEKYEFKIVRSVWGKFKNLETIQALSAEEAKAGWEMVEKFDNHRIRFKRNKTNRTKDSYLNFDPYRTSIESGYETIKSTSVGWFVLTIVLGILMLVGGTLFFVSGGYIEITDPAPLIIGGIVLFAIIVLLVVKKKSKENRPY